MRAWKAGQPQLGKYLCITDYTAEILVQTDGSLAAGKMAVAPEKQKFFVTIRVAPGRDLTKRECFTKEQGEALKYEPPPATTDELVDRLLGKSKDERERREGREGKPIQTI